MKKTLKQVTLRPFIVMLLSVFMVQLVPPKAVAGESGFLKMHWLTYPFDELYELKDDQKAENLEILKEKYLQVQDSYRKYLDALEKEYEANPLFKAANEGNQKSHSFTFMTRRESVKTKSFFGNDKKKRDAEYQRFLLHSKDIYVPDEENAQLLAWCVELIHQDNPEKRPYSIMIPNSHLVKDLLPDEKLEAEQRERNQILAQFGISYPDLVKDLLPEDKRIANIIMTAYEREIERRKKTKESQTFNYPDYVISYFKQKSEGDLNWVGFNTYLRLNDASDHLNQAYQEFWKNLGEWMQLSKTSPELFEGIQGIDKRQLLLMSERPHSDWK